MLVLVITVPGSGNYDKTKPSEKTTNLTAVSEDRGQITVIYI